MTLNKHNTATLVPGGYRMNFGYTSEMFGYKHVLSLKIDKKHVVQLLEMLLISRLGFGQIYDEIQVPVDVLTSAEDDFGIAYNLPKVSSQVCYVYFDYVRDNVNLKIEGQQVGANVNISAFADVVNLASETLLGISDSFPDALPIPDEFQTQENGTVYRIRNHLELAPKEIMFDSKYVIFIDKPKPRRLSTETLWGHNDDDVLVKLDPTQRTAKAARFVTTVSKVAMNGYKI